MLSSHCEIIIKVVANTRLLKSAWVFKVCEFGPDVVRATKLVSLLNKFTLVCFIESWFWGFRFRWIKRIHFVLMFIDILLDNHFW